VERRRSFQYEDVSELQEEVLDNIEESMKDRDYDDIDPDEYTK